MHMTPVQAPWEMAMHEPQPQVTVILGQPGHGWVEILDTEMASAKGGNQTDISQASTLLLTDTGKDPAQCPQEVKGPAQGGPCHSRPTYQHRS